MAQMNIESIKKIVVGGLVLAVFVAAVVIAFGFFNKTSGKLTINTIPAGAEFELAGKMYKTPAEIKSINEGSYTLTIEKEGYTQRKDSVNVSSSADNEYTFRLYTEKTSPSVLAIDLTVADEMLDPFKDFIVGLPVKFNHFTVELKIVSREPRVVVTLLAILNRSEQIDAYRDQLNSYKTEAIKWLEIKGFEPKDLDVIWEPSSANAL